MAKTKRKSTKSKAYVSKSSFPATYGSRILAIAFIIVFGVLGVHIYEASHAANGSPELESSVNANGNWCMNDKGGSYAAANPVNSDQCDGSARQQWVISGKQIQIQLPGDTKSTVHCIEPKDGGTSSGTGIVMDLCNGHPAQNWAHFNGGFENIAASSGSNNECLAVPAGNTGIQLTIQACSAQPDQNWTEKTYVTTASGAAICQPSGNGEGDSVASVANCELSLWNGDKENGKTATHSQMLSDFAAYDTGNPEAWCADFVSYAYKRAGYPFTGGEHGGWNWKSAFAIGGIEGYGGPVPGFHYHSAGSGYNPKVGDVAEFSGAGGDGHVEIVVATKGPTFVYGNDGSGGMAKNTYTGGLLGYVTP